MLFGALDLRGPVPPMSFEKRSLAQKLIKKLDAGEPTFIDVDPQIGCMRANCFNNVAMLTASVGGDMVVGWCLWEHPKLFARAEHHSIWRKPDGSLVDPTPKDDDFEQIVFVADHNATWGGSGHKARKSVWQANNDSRDAIELVRLERRREDLLEKIFLLGDGVGDELRKIRLDLDGTDRMLANMDQMLFRKGLLKLKQLQKLPR